MGPMDALTDLDWAALQNALNAVLNGPQAIEDWEFQTRMGVTRAEATDLQNRLKAAHR
jgi:hypothetical protein